MVNAISTLVGEELEEGYHKWHGSVAAPNGSIYGILSRARRVANSTPSINPSLKSDLTLVMEASASGLFRGAMTNNGVVYCPPNHKDRGILKIDTNIDNVTELD